MKAIARAKLAMAIARACPIALIAACGSSAAAETMADPVRPANFYEVATSNSSSICPAVLKSLNKKYVFPIVPNQPDVGRDSGKFLLTSDMQIHWRQVVGEKEYLDFAKVDFQNDGKPQLVYRFPGSLAGQVADHIGTSKYDIGSLDGINSMTPALLSQKIDRVEQADFDMAEPGKSSTPQWKDKKDRPRFAMAEGFPYLFFDVVAFAAGTYMLATSAPDAIDFYQHYIVLKDYKGHPRAEVYVLQYVKDGDIPMICHFRNRTGG